MPLSHERNFRRRKSSARLRSIPFAAFAANLAAPHLKEAWKIRLPLQHKLIGIRPTGPSKTSLCSAPGICDKLAGLLAPRIKGKIHAKKRELHSFGSTIKPKTPRISSAFKNVQDLSSALGGAITRGTGKSLYGTYGVHLIARHLPFRDSECLGFL
jgi:hypothetical protein